MWIKLSAVILNILLGIAGVYVFIFVLMNGGALSGSQSPSPTPLGYLVILVYFFICLGTNFPFARKSSSILKYCLTHVSIWLVSFFFTILL